jgi:hypothetical protein
MRLVSDSYAAEPPAKINTFKSNCTQSSVLCASMFLLREAARRMSDENRNKNRLKEATRYEEADVFAPRGMPRQRRGTCLICAPARKWSKRRLGFVERARGAFRWWAHCEALLSLKLQRSKERTRTASAKHRACGGVVGFPKEAFRPFGKYR